MASYVIHGTENPDIYYGAIILYDDGDVEGFGAYRRIVEDEEGDLTPVGKKMASGEVPISAYLHLGTYSNQDLLLQKKDVFDEEAEFIADLDYGRYES